MRIERIIFVILLLTADVGYCQKNQIQVLSNEKVLGKSLVDSIVFKGMEYVFPDRIHETFLDTTTGLLTVQLRGLSKNGKWLDNSSNPKALIIPSTSPLKKQILNCRWK